MAGGAGPSPALPCQARASLQAEAWDWKLADSDSDDEVLQVKSVKAGAINRQVAGRDSGQRVQTVSATSAAATPRSMTSTEASSAPSSSIHGTSSSTTGKLPGTPESVDCQQQDSKLEDFVVIPGDASLTDGLRILLVHHLKKGTGEGVLDITAGQAELLEHHLGRLALYGQKIVHTLAFATRFLSEQASGGEQDGDFHTEKPAEAPVPVQEPRPPKKQLKLKDEELLDIYRSAQREAGKEADWRGLGNVRDSNLEGVPRTAASSSSAPVRADSDLECLRAVSRAMQYPGRTPEAFAAEIADPSGGLLACCSRQALEVRRHGSSARVQWPQAPPDPGARLRAR